jgi:hypothetical protein
LENARYPPSANAVTIIIIFEHVDHPNKKPLNAMHFPLVARARKAVGLASKSIKISSDILIFLKHTENIARRGTR